MGVNVQVIYTRSGVFMFTFGSCHEEQIGNQQAMNAGLVDHMTMSESAEQLALDLAREVAQVGFVVALQLQKPPCASAFV